MKVLVSCAQVSTGYRKEDFGEVPIGTNTFLDPTRPNKAPYWPVKILRIVDIGFDKIHL
jgi:hypothetical protein